MHSGEDLSSPENIAESAGFYEVTNLSPHIAIAHRIGTNIYARLSHLEDTSNLRIGQVLSPGEFIGKIAPTFPSKSKKGVLHVEEFMREGNKSTLANPSTHIPATGIDFYWIRERKIRDSAFEPWYFEVLVNDPSVRPYRY